jgi:ssDNA-binding Zn-finger/Zn-ribbon topoisomerase 1
VTDNAYDFKCPHCGFSLLYSDDRGIHCDGCDDFDEVDVEEVFTQLEDQCEKQLDILKGGGS